MYHFSNIRQKSFEYVFLSATLINGNVNDGKRKKIVLKHSLIYIFLLSIGQEIRTLKQYSEESRCQRLNT